MGTRLAALVRVKLPERASATAAVGESPETLPPRSLAQTGLVDGMADRCFQPQNHGRGRRA